MGWSLPDRLFLARWGPGALVSLVFSISGERKGVKPGIPPRIERYGSVPPWEETPPNRLQLSRVHYLLPRTGSRHIQAGVTAAGFLMVKKMLDEYEAPPIDEGLDEALREFVMTKKNAVPDSNI